MTLYGRKFKNIFEMIKFIDSLEGNPRITLDPI